MTQKNWNRTKSLRRRGAAYLERAAGGLTLMLMHEAGALSGHLAEVRERLAVARKARNVAEMLRDQADLLPETRARLALDQRERRELISRWLSDLRIAA